jgi:o-succinylbenzoate---CoA ligase
MERPVAAVVLPPGPRLLRRLEAALAGQGPAICPLPPGLAPADLEGRLAALRPTEVETGAGVRPHPGGVPAPGPVAVLVATSGSLGRPKIAQLPAAALRASAEASLRRIGAGPGDRWLCCLPTSHIAGIQVLVRSLVAGTEPVIHQRFDPAAVAAALGGRRGGRRAAHLALVPTQLRRLLAAGADLSAPASILLGGAPATPDLLAAARDAGARVITTYGMSETSGGCVYDGVPLDGVEVDVAEDGRIKIAGPVLFDGYRLRPEESAEVRDGRWFRTGDLGSLSGGRLRVRGRADDVINTGGEKVLAGEVAAALAGHPGVDDVVVVGRADPEWGERVTAIVVPAPGAAGDPPTLAELRAWVRRSLPACAAPRELDLRTAIPLLPSGKPDLPRLRRSGGLRPG